MTGIVSALMLLYVLVSIKAPWWTIAVMVASVLGDVIRGAYKAGKEVRSE